MRPVEIENWALDVIRRVESGQPNEDARVELKSEWIPAQKAARLIAGHANAARGASILWLMGVDQREGVIGVDDNELANWYAQVAAEFDGVAPTMVDLNVPCGGKAVVALLFETDRAPFVIRNPAHGTKDGGPIALEVPWREGTRTRTATRSDLIRLLVPLLKLPEVEVLGGHFLIQQQDKCQARLAMRLYVTPEDTTAVVLPFHRCTVTVKLPSRPELLDLESIRLNPPYKRFHGANLGQSEPDSLTVAHTGSELILQGPGMVNLSAEAWVDGPPSDLEGTTAEIQAKLSPTHTDSSVVVSASMRWDPSDEKRVIGRWTL